MKFLQCLAAVLFAAAGAFLLLAGWHRQYATDANPSGASTGATTTAPPAATRSDAPPDAVIAQDALDAFHRLRACRRGAAAVASAGTCPADLGDARYFDAIARAAQAGDAQAQLCFALGDVDIAPLERHAAGAYAATAQRYIDGGIARGDWRFAQLLAASGDVHPRAQRRWRQSLPVPEAFDALKANRLLRLGARGDAALQVDLRGSDLSAALSPAEISAAGAWAQEAFDRHFADAGTFESLPEPCPG